MAVARITWTDPTTLISNVPIPANDFKDVEVYVSADGGKNYVNAGHAAPGTGSFDFDPGSDVGTFNFKLNCLDTQTPGMLGPDSIVVSVTVAPPALAVISAPTDVKATLV